MNLGILAHSFGKMKSQQLAETVGRHGFKFVQLALAKALTDFDYQYGMLSPGLANYVAEQFQSQGVRIGVLGCYINPIHPDEESRRAEIKRFKEHLRYARAFGTNIVATETGDALTYLQQYPQEYVEKAWSILRETMEQLAEEAEKWGVFVGIEPVSVHTVASPQWMQRLLEEVPSSNLGVVLDPCNLLDSRNIHNQDQIIRDSFELLKDRIVLIHAKDFKIDSSGSKRETLVGQGDLNHKLFFDLLNRYKPYIDVSLEGANPDTAIESRDTLLRLWEAAH
ncbi:Xylose isomerase-like TIM barrel [compost metagenome]